MIRTCLDFTPESQSTRGVKSKQALKFLLSFEGEEHRGDQQHERNDVVNTKCLGAENKQREHSENQQRNNLLNDLELDQRERSSRARKPDAVGRNLNAVLEKRDAPTDYDHGDKGQMVTATRCAQLQVAIPRHGHENIGDHQQADGEE